MTEIRQTVRRLLRAPGFTLTTILTLAIGIGATIAIFAVVNGILIHPLPFPDSDRLVALTLRSPRQGLEDLPASPAIYFTYKRNNRAFESVALWQAKPSSVTSPGNPEQVRTLRVTFDFLPTLRIARAFGRAFGQADDRPDSAPTVMLSYAYWQRRFGGAQSALGRNLVVDGVAYRIIGVMPRYFRFLSQSADILLPMRPDPAKSFVGPLGENGIARLGDGVTIGEANADVARMLPIVRKTFPAVPGVDKQWSSFEPDVKPLKELFVGKLGDVLRVLMGTIGMLLAVACANVANLHLVRTERRARDLAIQSALGASRAKLVLGLLRESILLALVGGVLGLALAAVVLRVLLSTAAAELPKVLAVTIDPTVVAFALVVSLGAGVLFGAGPALRYASRRGTLELGIGSRGYSVSRERHRVHQGLIAAQVAFALILLVASGLMIRTFRSLVDVDPGFVAPNKVQTVSVYLPRRDVPQFGRAIRMFQQMEEAIGSLSGVESVGFASRVPLAVGGGPTAGFFVENGTLPPGAAPPMSAMRFASPHFFKTLGTPLVAGRAFEWSDHLQARHVAVVSESFARREWGTPQSALGKRLRMSPVQPWNEVIGVVGNVHQERLDAASTDAVYLTLGAPLAQYMSRRVTFVIRSKRVGTAAFLQDIQRAVWSVARSVPLWDVDTLGHLYDLTTARTALTLLMLVVTGGMALLLGLVGIYGVIGYMLAQRRREVGIRIAIGARDIALKRMLLGRILVPVLAGVVLGLAGAAALSRLIATLLFGVTALDPETYALAALVLVATAALAAYLPARRVTRVDPMDTLRAE